MSVQRQKAKGRGTADPASGRAARGKGAREAFPPPSTSLDALLVEGSDREFRNLIYKVLSTSSLMLRARDRFAAQMGVSGPQYSMMVAIGEAGSATVGQIAAQLHVSSPFVTAEIGKLIRAGVVERRPNEADRRSSLLELTDKGREMIRQVGPFRRMTNDMIFGSLSREQVVALHEIMDKLLADSEHALYEINSPAWRRRPKAKDSGD